MIAIVLTIFLVLIDQGTKLLALKYLKPAGSIPVIEGVFHFTFVENEGAAFGIMQGMRWFFIPLTILIVLAIILYYRKLPTVKPYCYLRWTLIVIISGAIGNFIDRLLRGYVIDFLHASFINFPVFNIADCYVTIGAFVLCVLLLFVVKE